MYSLTVPPVVTLEKNLQSLGTSRDTAELRQSLWVTHSMWNVTMYSTSNLRYLYFTVGLPFHNTLHLHSTAFHREILYFYFITSSRQLKLLVTLQIKILCNKIRHLTTKPYTTINHLSSIFIQTFHGFSISIVTLCSFSFCLRLQ